MKGQVMNAVLGSVKERNEALEEMVNQVRLKLLGAEIMTGLNKPQLPGLKYRSGEGNGKQRNGGG